MVAEIALPTAKARSYQIDCWAAILCAKVFEIQKNVFAGAGVALNTRWFLFKPSFLKSWSLGPSHSGGVLTMIFIRGFCVKTWSVVKRYVKV
jgi:hypothetical protein